MTSSASLGTRSWYIFLVGFGYIRMRREDNKSNYSFFSFLSYLDVHPDTSGYKWTLLLIHLFTRVRLHPEVSRSTSGFIWKYLQKNIQMHLDASWCTSRCFLWWQLKHFSIFFHIRMCIQMHPYVSEPYSRYIYLPIFSALISLHSDTWENV